MLHHAIIHSHFSLLSFQKYSCNTLFWIITDFSLPFWLFYRTCSCKGWNSTTDETLVTKQQNTIYVV